jgi:Icc-related predicted phosphoesterase
MARAHDRGPFVAEPGGTQVRILAVSDLHYRLRQFDWLLTRASSVDAVVIAGDLLDVRSPVALDVQAVAVRAALRHLARTTLLFVASGNHDLDGRDAAGEKAARWMAPLAADGVHGDLETVPFGDDLVTVCPWWDGPRARAELDACLTEAATRPRRRWIWVHHAPPAGSPLAFDGHRAWGDDTLTGWIARFAPDLVLTGHVHQSPFVRGGGWVDRVGTTWVFNAGQQAGPVPARVEMDLDVGAAVWTAGGERAEVDLCHPPHLGATTLSGGPTTGTSEP